MDNVSEMTEQAKKTIHKNENVSNKKKINKKQSTTKQDSSTKVVMIIQICFIGRHTVEIFALEMNRNFIN